MIVNFEENGHIYSVNGEIASISVTELLAKHGLAPDYSGINKAKLKESADKGKEVHKDLENILNEPAYEPKTEQGKHFAEWVKENLDCGVGEQVLGYEHNGLIIAGTADIMAIAKDKTLIVADHKNTSKFHREYVSWQVSILDYFARKLGKEKINGKLLNWKGAKKFYCFHYDPKSGEMTVYELEKVADEEIERLIECEYKGETYQRAVLVVDPELQTKFLQAEEYLAQVELTFKQAEETAKAIREQMLSLFEKQGIKSWESPSGKVKVTYVEPTDRIGVDSTKLKKEYPQVFNDCQKLTKVKSQIRVKVRGDEDDE
jgi:hypothetical protein